MTRPTSRYSAFACIHLCMHPFILFTTYTQVWHGLPRTSGQGFCIVLLSRRERGLPWPKVRFFFFILRPKQVRRSYSDIHTYMCMHPFMHASIYACIHLCTKAKANAEIIQWHTHIHVHASIYACIHLCTKAEANAEIIQWYTQTYTHWIYTRTLYIHTHTIYMHTLTFHF